MTHQRDFLRHSSYISAMHDAELDLKKVICKGKKWEKKKKMMKKKEMKRKQLQCVWKSIEPIVAAGRATCLVSDLE